MNDYDESSPSESDASDDGEGEGSSEAEPYDPLLSYSGPLVVFGWASVISYFVIKLPPIVGGLGAAGIIVGLGLAVLVGVRTSRATGTSVLRSIGRSLKQTGKLLTGLD